MLYYEVAPVCHSNLETVIPMIWSSFNLEDLEACIKTSLEARGGSYFRGRKDGLLIRWLEFRYKYIWVEISKFYNK